MKKYERILFFTDMHIPFEHPDALNFCKYLKRTFQPTLVVSGGDNLDFHALSFHQDDVNATLTATSELELAIRRLEGWIDAFPDLKIMHSNHESMFYRKQAMANIPTQIMKTYNEVLNAPDTWEWMESLTIELPNGNKCMMHHGLSANALTAAKELGMCVIFGHHHSRAKIEYFGDFNQNLFAVNCGCLVDMNSYAMAYGKHFIKKPKLGAVVIIDSFPHYIPMQLDKDGRWADRQK